MLCRKPRVFSKIDPEMVAAGNTLTAFLTVLPMLIGLYGFGSAFAALTGFASDLRLRCRARLVVCTITLLPISVKVILIVVSMFVMIGLGLTVLRALERRVWVRGTVGHH